MTTQQVAGVIGIGPKTLLRYLSKHPELRPELRSGRVMFWDERSIVRLINFRKRPESKGGPATHRKKR